MDLPSNNFFIAGWAVTDIVEEACTVGANLGDFLVVDINCDLLLIGDRNLYSVDGSVVDVDLGFGCNASFIPKEHVLVKWF